MFDMKENDQFSNFNKKEKKNLLHFLKKYYVKYHPDLVIGNVLTFGIEIECLISNNTYEHKKYTAFNLVPEETVNRQVGGEFQSPVLCDNEYCWAMIKKTCDYLKVFCKTNENCGGHIHFGTDIFKNNPKYLRNLIYLWLAFEDVIYRFGNGEMLNTRFLADMYARPVINSFEYFLRNDDLFSDIEKFLEVFKNMSRNFGINFNNYYAFYMGNSLDKNTVEFRSPNGTLEEVIWQNNINFFGKLILAACSNDLDLFDLYLQVYETNYYDKNLLEQYGKIKLDKALKLADLIYDNNGEKLDFLKQYIKDGRVTNNKSLVRSKRFWV